MFDKSGESFLWIRDRFLDFFLKFFISGTVDAELRIGNLVILTSVIPFTFLTPITKLNLDFLAHLGTL